MEPESRHQCLIYKGPPSQKLPMLAAILKCKLDEGYRCLYLNSPPMVAGMASTLAALGIDVVSEIDNARLILSSETVSTGKDFNSAEMLDKLEDTLNQAIQDGYKGLWASGDMTWEFGPMKDFSKLMEYECGLEELFQRRPEMCGVCQYHQDTLPQDAMQQSLLTHSKVIINETLSQINPWYLKSAWPADADTGARLNDMIASLAGNGTCDK